MNILYIEPFYSGSHKHFADQLKKHSRHSIHLLTLEGKFWKWRMYGAAITLGNMFLGSEAEPSLIMVTDMLDLPTFLGLVRHRLDPDIPIITYFHENQMTYPWQPDSVDRQLQRDHHYGMMNYQTAMVADHNLYNSAYNKESFYQALDTLMSRMPDHKHTDLLPDLWLKSSVMPLGLELDALVDPAPVKDPATASLPLILWNHRWEHDKNPVDFFNALEALKDLNIGFRLAVLGQAYKHMPDVFNDVPERFFKELVHFGYAPYEVYRQLLNEADLLPVTSRHEFFGISVMEAIHCGATPLLPKRLSYTELYKPDDNPGLFYDNQKDLIEKLADYCQTFQPGPRDRYRHLTGPYDWKNRIEAYDAFFDDYGTN